MATAEDRELLEQFSEAVRIMLAANCDAKGITPRIAILAGSAGLAKFVCEVAQEGSAGTALRDVAAMISERFEQIAERCDAYDAASPAERRRMEAALDFTNSAPAGRA
jgi:hypothetical protein